MVISLEVMIVMTNQMNYQEQINILIADTLEK